MVDNLFATDYNICELYLYRGFIFDSIERDIVWNCGTFMMRTRNAQVEQ